PSRTAAPAIIPAGEVTLQFTPLLGPSQRIERRQIAETQPAVAAANRLGGAATSALWPWVGSDQYESYLQRVGLFGGA
ncbi:pyridine nucleotide-disulfide oxidoreductase, partial [Burkholderia pseudomallei]